MLSRNLPGRKTTVQQSHSVWRLQSTRTCSAVGPAALCMQQSASQNYTVAPVACVAFLPSNRNDKHNAFFQPPSSFQKLVGCRNYLECLRHSLASRGCEGRASIWQALSHKPSCQGGVGPFGYHEMIRSTGQVPLQTLQNMKPGMERLLMLATCVFVSIAC